METKKLTALQKLINKWESEKGSYIPNAPIYQCFIDDAKELLELEKEQIIEANIRGSQGCLSNFKQMGISREKTAEQYYNETYGNKESN